MSDSEQCSEPTWIWPNFTFGQFLMWIGANNDQIWLPMGQMSDSEQFSNRFELDLISLLVNFSCELGQIRTIYDFPMGWMSDSEQCLEPTWAWPNFTFGQLFMWIEANNGHIWLPIGYMSDSEQCSNWLELYLISLLVIFSCELGQIMTRYDFLWARWVILSNFLTDLNFT